MSSSNSRGGYQLLEKIGEGAMGEVYRAVHGELKREVALKCLRAEHAPSGNALARFRREARALSRVSHPSLVKVLDVAEDGDEPFLAMELITGRTLEVAVAADPAGMRRDADRIFLATADAVAALHDAGLVHRDLKPANIMLTHTGRVVVMDLGVVKDFHGDWTQLTEAGAVIGTPAYFAPEVLRNAEAGAGADVWGLGAIYFFLHAARPLFAADELPKLLAAIVHDPLPDLARACPQLDAPRREFLKALLERDVARRPRDARHVLELFGRATGDRTPSPRTDPNATPSRAVARVPVQRTAWGALGAGALAAALLALSMAAASRRADPVTVRASAVPPPASASPGKDVDEIEANGILQGLGRITEALGPTMRDAPQHEDAHTSEFAPRNKTTLRTLGWMARELVPLVRRAFLLEGQHVEHLTHIDALIINIVRTGAEQLEFAVLTTVPEAAALKEALRELRAALDSTPRSLEMRAVRASVLRDLDDLIARGRLTPGKRRAAVRGACKLLRDDAARRGWSSGRLRFLICLLGDVIQFDPDPEGAVRRELVELTPLYLSPGMRSPVERQNLEPDTRQLLHATELAADRAASLDVRRRAVEAALGVAPHVASTFRENPGGRALIAGCHERLVAAVRELGVPDRAGAIARLEARLATAAKAGAR